jgi:predicted DNA-binding mobile mystery protein A
MIDHNKKLLIGQLDKKFEKISGLTEATTPPSGWIYSIRTALNMSLTQLARRLKKTAQSVKEIEEREQSRNITLKKLAEVAEALDLSFYYCFLPKESSIEKMIEKRAYQIAREIVMRTSHSMSLEEQENTPERLEKAIKDKAEQIKSEMPKYLWD